MSLFKKIHNWYCTYFIGKKIVHSKQYPPGELCNYFKKNGVSYVRIKITNRQLYVGYNPVTDIPVSKIVRIDKLKSKFYKWYASLFKVKTAKKIFIINKKK
jgi:hypothetical protein